MIKQWYQSVTADIKGFTVRKSESHLFLFKIYAIIALGHMIDNIVINVNVVLISVGALSHW